MTALHTAYQEAPCPPEDAPRTHGFRCSRIRFTRIFQTWCCVHVDHKAAPLVLRLCQTLPTDRAPGVAPILATDPKRPSNISQPKSLEGNV